VFFQDRSNARHGGAHSCPGSAAVNLLCGRPPIPNLMQNLLAKLVALGILAGGFALTGDLGWLAERGQRVIGAAEVASAPAIAVVDAPPAPLAAASPVAAPVASEPAVSPIETTGPHAQTPQATPAGSVTVAEFRPPAGGPQRVSLADLRAGDRVVVWLASTRHRCLVFDMVEPVTGGALVYEAAAVTHQGQPLAAAGPPRRVTISGPPHAGSAAAEIIRGGMLHLAEAGLAAAARDGEWLGPIESLAIIN
jgi:hypothetical protein